MNFTDKKQYAIAPIDLVSTKFECWKCKQLTLVSCLKVYDFDDGYGPRGGAENRDADRRYCLTNIEKLPQVLVDALTAKNPNVRMAESRTTQSTYLANNCEHCGALQGDFFLHTEPDGPFFAGQFPADADIQRVANEGRFEVECSCAG